MTRMKNNRSFKKQLFTILLCIMIPLCALLLINSLYSVGVFNEKIAESNQRTVQFCADQIQRELTAVDETLTGVVAGNSDFMTLSGGTSGLQAHLSSFMLIEQLKTVMPAYPNVHAFFIYSIPSNTQRDYFANGYTYADKQTIRTFVKNTVADGSITYAMKWKYAEVDGRYYLFRFFGGRGTCIAAMIPLDSLLQVGDWRIDTKTVAAFTAPDGMPLTQQAFIEDHKIALDGDFDSYFLSGSREKFMVIGETIRNTDCRLVFLLSGVGYLDALNPVQLLLLGLSFLTVLLIPALITWVNHTIIVPLQAITKTMREIQGGNLDAQVETEGHVEEFRQMGDTFNTMIGQIKSLRITTYEHQIESQKAQLKYLQLQIRPHFFLNCLKSIYAFAQQKQYQKLQKLILRFSNHIRYIFQDCMEFVPLERELNHVRNYMEIQGISAVHPPVCIIHADPTLLQLPIPPLLIQTFVENSVKHETNPDKALEVTVEVKSLDPDGCGNASIVISDNGSGFPEKILSEINQSDGSVYAHHHVGLNNVKKRLALIYGDRARIAFYNSEKGSVSDIVLPVGKQELPQDEHSI